MAPVVVLLVVLGTFALLLHSVPLLIDESLSQEEFDDALAVQTYSFTFGGLVSVHVVRRMSGAWLLGTTTLSVFKHQLKK